MNQKIINVNLISEDSESDVLRFEVDDTKIDVNLNDENCQNTLKRVFTILLEQMIDNDIKLNFSVTAEYTRQMYIEVCKEYIDDLNR